jgi:hypothetical protein
MKPGDLVFMQYNHDDYDGDDFKAGDTGLIIAHSPETRHHNHSDDLAFEVLVHGKIYFLFDYEMVLVEGAERLPIYQRNEIK